MSTAYRTAVVTGGGRGIGRAVAIKLSQLGLRVAVIGRSEQTLAETVQLIASGGGQCVSRTCDISNWESVKSTAISLHDELGTIDILVNNAGGWMGGAVEVADPSLFKNLVDATLVGAFHLSKALIPYMRGAGAGYILNIGSTSGLGSSRDSVTASAPKAALESFSRLLSAELQSSGIKVGILHPARVNKKLPDEQAEALGADGRFSYLTARQVAEIAGFMIMQPPNVAIREVIVTPANVDY